MKIMSPLSREYVWLIRRVQGKKQRPTSASERRERARRIKAMLRCEINRMAEIKWVKPA